MLVPLLFSCYKDKGNYDYKAPADRLAISDSMYTNYKNRSEAPFQFKSGEKIVIPAKYKIMDEGLRKENLKIEWLFEKKIVGTGDTLKFDLSGVGRYYGILNITDTETEYVYSHIFAFSINASYGAGIAFSSENDGVSKLGFISLDPNKEDSFNFIGNVFEGSEIPLINGKIKELSVHQFSIANYSLSVVQDGETGPVDIGATEMNKIGRIKDEFISGGEGLDIESVAYKNFNFGFDYFVYALTSDGKIYARQDEERNADPIPHSGYFTSEPLSAQGGYKATHWINTSTISSTVGVNIEYIIGYDDLNKRCFELTGYKIRPFGEELYLDANEENRGGKGFDGVRYYDDIRFPGPENLSEYDVIDMKASGYSMDLIFSGEHNPIHVAMFLKKKDTGKNYVLVYNYSNLEGEIDINLKYFYPLPDEIDPKNMVAINNLAAFQTRIFLTGADKRSIYALNTTSGLLKKVYSAQQDISALGMGEVSNLWSESSNYFDKFFVGYENGNIEVLKMDDEAVGTGNPQVLQTLETGLGKITHFDYISRLPQNF